ncbi:MAG: hypothetical protein ACK5MT_05395 [Actinomycetales bacterium]
MNRVSSSMRLLGASPDPLSDRTTRIIQAAESSGEKASGRRRVRASSARTSPYPVEETVAARPAVQAVEQQDGRVGARAQRRHGVAHPRPQRGVRVDPLEARADELTGCIGCGCLSMKACSMLNPDDALAAAGPGARRLLDAQDAKHRESASAASGHR